MFTFEEFKVSKATKQLCLPYLTNSRLRNCEHFDLALIIEGDKDVFYFFKLCIMTGLVNLTKLINLRTKVVGLVKLN